MKCASYFLFALLLFSFASCKTTTQVGKVTVISERPIDFSQHYELKALARTGAGQTIQEAVSNVIRLDKEGLFLQNVIVEYLKNKGYKVTGDIWGISRVQQGQVNESLNKGTYMPKEETSVSIRPGDKVEVITPAGRTTTGVVVSVEGVMAEVQFRNFRNSIVKRMIPVKNLKKLY